MRPAFALIGLALQVAVASAQAPALEVASAGGLFHARLQKAVGQERVADSLARWKLAVRDGDGRLLWETFHPAPVEGHAYHLAQDGSVFCEVDPVWSDARAVVRLVVGDTQPLKLFGGELGIARQALRAAEPAGAWLAGSEPVRFGWVLGRLGPRQVLELDCVDGEVRKVDLENGRPLDAGGGLVRVWADPPFAKDSVPPSAGAPVVEWSASESVSGDVPVVVTLSGNFPNPGWRVFAFALSRNPDGLLVLTPRARPPLPPGVTIQQLEPFSVEARIHGLPPGEHRIAVQGSDGIVGEPRVVRVSAGGVLARLRTTGGILGLDETITLYENGTYGRESNRNQGPPFTFAAPRAFADVRGRLARLPGISPGALSTGSDLRTYELEWRVAGQWRRAEADDGNLGGELRDAVQAVRALAQG